MAEAFPTKTLNQAINWRKTTDQSTTILIAHWSLPVSLQPSATAEKTLYQKRSKKIRANPWAMQIVFHPTQQAESFQINISNLFGA